MIHCYLSSMPGMICDQIELHTHSFTSRSFGIVLGMFMLMCCGC